MTFVLVLAAASVVLVGFNIYSRLVRLQQRLQKTQAQMIAQPDRRQAYDELVILYNESLQTFPTSVLGAVFRFQPVTPMVVPVSHDQNTIEMPLAHR